MGRGIVMGGLFGLVFSGLVLALTSQFTDRRSLPAPREPQPEAVVPEPVQPPMEAEPVAVPEAAPDAPLVPGSEADSGARPDDGGALVNPPDAPDTPSLPDPEAALPAAPAAPVVAGVPDVPEPPGEETGEAGAPGAPPPSTDVAQTAPATPPATLAEDALPVVLLPSGPGPVAKESGVAPGMASAAPGDPAPLAPGGETAPETMAAPQPPVGPGPVVTGIGAGLPAAPVKVWSAPRTPATERAPSRVAPLAAAAAPGPEPVMTTPAAPDRTTLTVAVSGLAAPAAPGPEPVTPRDEAALPGQSLPQAPVEVVARAALPVTEAAPDAPVAEPVVITDRLPRIGDPVEPPDAVIGETGTDESDTAPDAPLAADALTRNGVPFDNPDGRPIVSVVLLDNGGAPVRLPFPVSVAIDAAADDAAQRAADYRAAGVEVLVLAQIPPGATASDVSVVLQGTFNRIPDAVALFESPDGELQVNRDVTAQMLSELADTGHGFLTFPRGFNSVLQLAERQGVVAGLVFREIDAGDLDVRGIKRFLDQAAFRARQEDSVILVGRNAPETIAALAEWALGNRAASVALVPVSAALKAAAR